MRRRLDQGIALERSIRECRHDENAPERAPARCVDLLEACGASGRPARSHCGGRELRQLDRLDGCVPGPQRWGAGFDDHPPGMYGVQLVVGRRVIELPPLALERG
jgi:hypothetical protein